MKTLQELEAQQREEILQVVRTLDTPEVRAANLEQLCITIRQLCLADAYQMLIKAIKAGELKL